MARVAIATAMTEAVTVVALDLAALLLTHSAYRTFALIPPQQLGPKYQRCWYICPALLTQFVALTVVQLMRVSVQSNGVKLNLPSRKVLRVLQLMFPDSAAGNTKVEPVKSLAVLHMLVGDAH